MATLIHIGSDNSGRVDSKPCDGRQFDWSTSVCVVNRDLMSMSVRHGEKRGFDSGIHGTSTQQVDSVSGIIHQLAGDIFRIRAVASNLCHGNWSWVFHLYRVAGNRTGSGRGVEDIRAPTVEKN